MGDSTHPTDTDDCRQQHHHRQNHQHHHDGRTPVGEYDDDECSSDSYSSGSTGSGEHLSRCSSDDRTSRSPKTHCYLDRLRASGRSTRSQDRDSHVQSSSKRSWSRKDIKSLSRDGISPSQYSSSSSDAHIGSDNDFLKRQFTPEILRRAFQSLKINSSKRDNKEKKHAKKSPKRILRSPVSYIYVRGLSGLPTQRVPRNAGIQHMKPYSCQDLIGLYR